MSSDRHRILKLHDEHVARKRDLQGPSFFRCRGAVSGAGGRFSLLVSVVYTPLPLVAGLEALFCLGSLLQGDESSFDGRVPAPDTPPIVDGVPPRIPVCPFAPS